MQTDNVMAYHGCEVRPVVTATGNGRYAAAAIVTDPAGETRTLGVDGDCASAREVRDEALELAVAWIQQRSVVSERYVRRIWRAGRKPRAGRGAGARGCAPGSGGGGR
nr:hypothetical protein [Burkholderia cepacia]